MTLVAQQATGTARAAVALGRLGVWSPRLRQNDEPQLREDVGMIERLGYGAAWVPAGAAPGVLGTAELLLDATGTIAVVPVLDVGVDGTPAEVAAQAAALHERHRERVVLAVANRPVPLDPDQSRWSLQAVEVMDAMRGFLDALEAAEPPIPREGLLLGAIERPLLELARERAGGVIASLMPPEHTRLARETIGPEATLAVQQAVVYETDPSAARGYGRRFLSTHLGFNSYTRALRELIGARDGDLEGGASDALVDELVPWGDESKIRARVYEHFEAGADHVCLQVIETGSESEMDSLDRLFLSLLS